MSLPLSGLLGAAQLGAAELGQFLSTAVVPPPPPPPPPVFGGTTSGQAFGDDEFEHRIKPVPVKLAKPELPKPKKKKRKKRKKAEYVNTQVLTSEVELPGLKSLVTEAQRDIQVAVSLLSTEQARLVKLRETIEEEDELLLLGFFR